MVCHSLLQWTTFCQTCPPWPARPGWPHTAWLSFIELDKAVIHVIRWLVFCDYDFSVSALWCPLATPTVLLVHKHINFLKLCSAQNLWEATSMLRAGASAGPLAWVCSSVATAPRSPGGPADLCCLLSYYPKAIWNRGSQTELPNGWAIHHVFKITVIPAALVGQSLLLDFENLDFLFSLQNTLPMHLSSQKTR